LTALRRRTVVPLLGALPLAGAIAAIAFGLQSSLSPPPPGARLTTEAVGRLERLHVVDALEQLPGVRPLRTTCTTRHHVNRLFIAGRLEAVIHGAHFVSWIGGGGAPTRRLVDEAELAGCPGFLVDELSHRLRFGLATFRRRIRLGRGRTGDILRAHGPLTVVELTVSRRSMVPLRVRLVTPQLRATADIVSASATAGVRRLPVRALTAADYLHLAETGLAHTERVFWNPSRHWYDERVSRGWNPARPLARLWSAFPLFEAIDAVAIADPTPANRAAVESFTRGAERYFDANLSPAGGYVWYPGIENPREHAYFDDNGWWELSYLDAYRSTGDRRNLLDAEKAFRFIAVAGWDPVSGGTWWETLHLHKTSEPLAAEIYTGLGLYQITGDRTYLDTALRFLRWANRHSWNAGRQLYSRSATDGTVLDYVEGMMVGADLELCRIRHVTGRCPAAEQLAKASLAAFPRDADWTPVADVVYLRFLLALYHADGNRAWYDLVAANAHRALTLAVSSDGLYFKRWDGQRFPARLLQPDAATLSLFAWLAGVPPPRTVGARAA
jgi:hypothetical protein